MDFSIKNLKLEIELDPAKKHLLYHYSVNEEEPPRIPPQPWDEPHARKLAASVVAHLSGEANAPTGEGLAVEILRKAANNLYVNLIHKELSKLLNPLPGPTFDDSYLLLRVDAELLWIPWELLYDGQEFLCQRFRVSRQVRRTDKEVDALCERTRKVRRGKALVVFGHINNPKLNAEKEEIAVRPELEKIYSVQSLGRKLHGTDLLQALERDSEVVHFVGHGAFSEGHPEQTGWRCADGHILNCNEIRDLPTAAIFPFLIFANACDSARPFIQNAEQYIGELYVAFLRRGVPHYIGTLAPIPDELSGEFAANFYHRLAEGASIGQALAETRRKFMESAGPPIWAYYVYYGDPSARLPLAESNRLSPKGTRDISRRSTGLIETGAERFLSDRGTDASTAPGSDQVLDDGQTPGPLKNLGRVKVFLCRAESDRRIAEWIVAELRSFPLLHVVNPSFSEEPEQAIVEHIHESDHVLCLLSEDAQKDPSVSRVLGLSLALRRRRDRPHPSIFGILTGEPMKSLVFPITAWPGFPCDTDKLDFNLLKKFKVTERFDRLADSVRAKLSFMDGSDERDNLLHASFRAYEELFPDQNERDAPEDIKDWLIEAGNALANGTPWREFYAVLHAAENVIGMAYITGHVGRDWFFGNYFGVRTAWRMNGRAKELLLGLADAVSRKIPRAKGIVFEVDPIDLPLLEKLSACKGSGLHESKEQINACVRAYTRLRLYQGFHCLTVLDGHGKPLLFWQPSMSKKNKHGKPVPLHLMVYFFDRGAHKLYLGNRTISSNMIRSLVDFVYDDVYREAYADPNAILIKDFCQRLERVKAKVFRAQNEWSLGSWHISQINQVP